MLRSISATSTASSPRGESSPAHRRDLPNCPTEFSAPDTPSGAETHEVRWLGSAALEQTHGEARAACLDKVVVVAAVSGRGARATKAEEDGFFDNVELTK